MNDSGCAGWPGLTDRRQLGGKGWAAGEAVVAAAKHGAHPQASHCRAGGCGMLVLCSRPTSAAPSSAAACTTSRRPSCQVRSAGARAATVVHCRCRKHCCGGAWTAAALCLAAGCPTHCMIVLSASGHGPRESKTRGRVTPTLPGRRRRLDHCYDTTGDQQVTGKRGAQGMVAAVRLAIIGFAEWRSLHAPQAIAPVSLPLRQPHQIVPYIFSLEEEPSVSPSDNAGALHHQRRSFAFGCPRRCNGH